jgi:hypothetical protein
VETTWQAIKVIAVTAGIVLAAAWAARQAGKRLVPHGRGRHLEVLDSLSLGVQRGLFLVRAGGRLLVVGVARDSVALLSEIDPSGSGDVCGAVAGLRPGSTPPGDGGSRTWHDAGSATVMGGGTDIGAYGGPGARVGPGARAAAGIPSLSSLWPPDKLSGRVALRLDELCSRIRGRRES